MCARRPTSAMPFSCSRPKGVGWCQTSNHGNSSKSQDSTRSYQTSFTKHETAACNRPSTATSLTCKPDPNDNRHQILRLPRKMTLMIDLRHIWNVISNARSNNHHPPTSPNTAPATQNCIPKSKRNCPKTVEVSIPMRGRFEHDPNMIRTRSEHDPSMNSSSRTRPFAEVTFRASETHFVLKITTFRAPAIYPDFTEYCACHKKWHSKITKYCSCHAKWLSWLMSVTHDTSFTMRGATDLILQHHQMLRLPRKMTRIIYPRDIWNVIYNARSSKHHLPSSPNAATAT